MQRIIWCGIRDGNDEVECGSMGVGPLTCHVVHCAMFQVCSAFDKRAIKLDYYIYNYSKR